MRTGTAAAPSPAPRSGKSTQGCSRQHPDAHEGSQTQVTNTTGPTVVQVNADPGPKVQQEGFLQHPSASPVPSRAHPGHHRNSTRSAAQHGTRTRAESYSCCGNHNFKISDSPALKGRARQKVTFPYIFFLFYFFEAAPTCITPSTSRTSLGYQSAVAPNPFL